MRHVIIGASAAGASAAEDIRRLDPAAEITLITEENYLPYSRCLLSRYVDGRLPEAGMYFKTRRFFEDCAIQGLVDTRVVAVDRARHRVRCADGREVAYDRLLLATGSKPAFPKVPGLDLRNVFAFHGMDDAKGILAAAQGATQAVVVGAGFAGLEAAYALARIGKKVTVIERCAQILPNQLDEPGARIIQADLEKTGVSLVFNESVTSLAGHDTVESVTIGDGSHLQCELCVVATGMRPSKQLAADAGLKADRGILVDEHMQTSDPDIFAAGDAIEIDDVSSGKRVCSATWFNAVLQGRFAAYNMVGRPRKYSGGVGIQNAVQFHHVPAISFGQTLIDAEDDSDFEVISTTRGNVYKKLVLKENRLCGMVFVGDIAKSGFYAALIRHQVDLSTCRDRLLDSDFSYAHLIRQEHFNQKSPYADTVEAWDLPGFWAARAVHAGIVR